MYKTQLQIQCLDRRKESSSGLRAFQGTAWCLHAEFRSSHFKASYLNHESHGGDVFYETDIQGYQNDPIRILIETLHKNWGTGFSMVKERN